MKKKMKIRQFKLCLILICLLLFFVLPSCKNPKKSGGTVCLSILNKLKMKGRVAQKTEIIFNVDTNGSAKAVYKHVYFYDTLGNITKELMLDNNDSIKDSWVYNNVFDSNGNVIRKYYKYQPTQVILHLNGYFGVPAGASALSFYPVPPCRVADTRRAAGTFGGPEMEAGDTRSFAIPESVCNIPSTAEAYSLNVTVLPDGVLQYLTAWPAGAARPNASTLNSWAQSPRYLPVTDRQRDHGIARLRNSPSAKDVRDLIILVVANCWSEESLEGSGQLLSRTRSGKIDLNRRALDTSAPNVDSLARKDDRAAGNPAN